MRKARILLLLSIILAGTATISVRGSMVAEADSEASKARTEDNGQKTLEETAKTAANSDIVVISTTEVAYVKSWGGTLTLSGEYQPRLRRAIRQKPAQEPMLLAVVDQPEIKLKHRIIADGVLRALPAKCRDALRDFYVRYEKPKNRGLAGKHVLILDGTVPDEEFRTLMVHELGHVIDLGCLAGSNNTRPTAFKDGRSVIYANDPSVSYYRISWLSSTKKRRGAVKADFASGYAFADPFEDFSEGLVYYVFQRDSFKRRAATNRTMALKLRWFDRYFGPGYSVASGTEKWSGKVPWDVTKLEYVWHPGNELAQR